MRETSSYQYRVSLGMGRQMVEQRNESPKQMSVGIPWCICFVLHIIKILFLLIEVRLVTNGIGDNDQPFRANYFYHSLIHSLHKNKF